MSNPKTIEELVNEIRKFCLKQYMPYKEQRDDIIQEMTSVALERLHRRKEKGNSDLNFNYKHLYIDTLRRLKFVNTKIKNGDGERARPKDVLSGKRDHLAMVGENNDISLLQDNRDDFVREDLDILLTQIPVGNAALIKMARCGLSSSEIAKLFGVSESYVSTRIKKIILNPHRITSFYWLGSKEKLNRDIKSLCRAIKILEKENKKIQKENNALKKVRRRMLQAYDENVLRKTRLKKFKEGMRTEDAVSIGDDETVIVNMKNGTNVLSEFTTKAAEYLRLKYGRNYAAKVLGVSPRTIFNMIKRSESL